MQRRGFLGAILAAGMAPAYVGAKVLMPVKALVSGSVMDIGMPFTPEEAIAFEKMLKGFDDTLCLIKCESRVWSKKSLRNSTTTLWRPKPYIYSTHLLKG